jgi:D-alanine-D-alanine ligase-like ATP-grasp enzyme
MAKTALVYNLIHPHMLQSGPLDRIAEYDSEETILALSDAIRAGGHQVIPLEADESIAGKLMSVRPQIVFNIAEGIRGESRESHVPAICEMLGLPYTGSGPLTLALCLNKARAKEVLRYYHISTPPFQVFHSPEDKLDSNLRFPLITKLLHEGSSMGLSERSIVEDEMSLKYQVEHLVKTYGQPALVEEFIEGREFTVGVLGNEEARVLPIIEVVFSKPRGIVLFNPDNPVIPLIRQAKGDGVQLPSVHHYAVCPADTSEELAHQITQTALKAFRVLGCRDWCRMEMRLGHDGTLYVLELNPIAGIDPSYWLPRAAEVAGLSYKDLVNEILDHALARAGLQVHAFQRPVPHAWAVVPVGVEG